MDKVLYASFKIKVWEDQNYKIDKQKNFMALNLDEIKLQSNVSRRDTTNNEAHKVTEFGERAL